MLLFPRERFLLFIALESYLRLALKAVFSYSNMKLMSYYIVIESDLLGTIPVIVYTSFFGSFMVDTCFL